MTMPEQLSRVRRKLAEQGRRMNPCLSEDHVRRFEDQWNVRLPDDYRAFLLPVGNGGPGPSEAGLLPLGEVPTGYDRPASDVLRDASRAFPFTTAWVWEGEVEDDPEMRDAVQCGKLVLGDDGCGQYWILIVTGPERGRVWFESGVGIAPCVPPRGFLDWYEYWLDGGRDYLGGS